MVYLCVEKEPFQFVGEFDIKEHDEKRNCHNQQTCGENDCKNCGDGEKTFVFFKKSRFTESGEKRGKEKMTVKIVATVKKTFVCFKDFYEISDSEKVGRGREKRGERRSRSRLTENDEDS